MANNSNQTQYLFQAAIGRSGSTILRQSIGLHPDVYYNGMENNLIQDVLDVAHRNCTLPSRAFAMKVDQPTYDDAFRQLINNLIWPSRNLRTRQVHFAAINPSNENLNYLSQLYPNSKIVCLVRDGIEVVCSRMNYESFENDDFESQCLTWTKCKGMLDWGIQNPSQFFLFRHEWMYNSELVKEHLAQMFDWIGVKPNDQVTNNFSSVGISEPTTEMSKPLEQMNDQEKQSYFRSKGKRWETWSVKQRNSFAQICGQLMGRLGYKIPFEVEPLQSAKSA